MTTDQLHIHTISDHLFRHEAGKMVAVLTKVFGTENLELSEDVVQEVFLTAVQVWALKGLPENPSAWLMHAAKNKAIDAIRRNKFSSRMDFSATDRKLLQSEYTMATQIEKLWQEDEIRDDLLRMMFACCHPEVAVESQITLIMKTLCGFSTHEIAKAFLTSHDTISKRLYRTKAFYRERKIKPEFPAADQLKGRTDAVLKAIYLLFNEGYNSTVSDQLIRKDLLGQAMYLCKLLCDTPHTQLPEVYAAMALMCLHAARINSRVSPEGELILLAHQDRATWDRELIREGNAYLNKAAFGESISSYHIEAAIAYEHCTTIDFNDTNWQRILAYYDLLVQVTPTAMVALNRLAVIFKLKGPGATFEEIAQSGFTKEWEKLYLYHSLLGELYLATDTAQAVTHLQKAISLTNSEAEKNLLRKKVAHAQQV
ncbi:sigma-70 family RNA polymerase sigma factor [Pontibacter sp. E15-1]|uniref:RNA polymerase sigma factor n=1 Tax=Pontibacter sp. E15-1 TaxID=2919918 RepID=UPI001F4F1328|nr:sigma-70 family RNA polymerase sigma factor [Pontibacter sp. E15-1]MCJ8164248.1 sigma-70 family RNA polymerase sigma factor [Pontibacter sp. E15-1]